MTNDNEQPKTAPEEPTLSSEPETQTAALPAGPLPADATAPPAEEVATPVATAAPVERRRWRPSRGILAGVAGVAVALLLFGSGFAAGSQFEGGHDNNRPRMLRQAPGSDSTQQQPPLQRREGQRGLRPQPQDRLPGRNQAQ